MSQTDNSDKPENSGSLADHFLIAMPSLNDGFFNHTVTYICEHDENGEADQQIIFDTPVEERWQAAARLIGIDLSLLSSDAGHA